MNRKISLFFVLMRVLSGSVFIYSGWGKLMAPVENFMAVIQEYQFMPVSFVPAAAHLIPWLELVFGTFLVAGFLTRASSGLMSALAVTFIAILIRSIVLRMSISECGCFGAGISLAPWQAAVLDFILLGSLLMTLARKSHTFSLDQKLSP